MKDIIQQILCKLNMDTYEHKKERIKLLTLNNVPGAQTLYSKIPFFMRSRLSGLIDYIQWEDIKNGCDNNDHSAFQKARSAFDELIKKMEQYLEVAKQQNKEAGSDNMMLMRTDLNYIINQYKDAVSFVRAMAECIQKEDDLILEYCSYKEESSPISDNQSPVKFNFDEMSEDVSEATIGEEEETVDEEMKKIKETVEVLKSLLTKGSHSESLFPGNTLDPCVFQSEDNLDLLQSLGQEPQLERILCYLNSLSQAMKEYVETLSNNVSTWKKDEARGSVGVGPEVSMVPLEKSFSYFAAQLQEVLSWFDNEFLNNLRQINPREMAVLQADFDTILQSFFSCNLVVHKQPKDLMSIESVGSKKSKEENAGGQPEKTKTKRRYCTKKKNNFETGLKFLGGQHFKVNFDSYTIDLVAEKDLAECSGGQKDHSSKLEYKPSFASNESELSVTFSNVAIKSFSRVEQNHIYKQFFRLKYTLNISIKQHSIELTTYSLPFMFNTGSNQILELIAARMWYCANFEIYDGNFVCEDSLDVDRVLTMLNDRVLNLDPNRSRGLTSEEMEFLKSRLPNSSSGRITMQGFIKDKLKKTRTNEELGYSFHTWFYAVLYGLKTHLLRPWIDGFLYGFCSEITAMQLLESQSVGTFIIRPSISREINSMSSREACADFTLDIKMTKENASHDGDYFVQSIPLLIKRVKKYSLYGAIAGIKKDNKPIATYCLTRNGKKNISYLRKYSSAKSSNEDNFEDYKVVLEKIEQINIKDIKSEHTRASNLENEVIGAPQRKRQCPKFHSPVNCSGPSTTPQPPPQNEEVFLFDSDFQNQSWGQGYNLVQDATATVQGQRSGHQSISRPAFSIAMDQRNPVQSSPCILRLSEGIEVDTSQLKAQPFEMSEENLASFLKHLVECNPQIDLGQLITELSPEEITSRNSGMSSSSSMCVTMVDNHYNPAENSRFQFQRMNSYPSSNFSSSTYNSSPPATHDDPSWCSPSDSGIDRDLTPSPPFDI